MATLGLSPRVRVCARERVSASGGCGFITACLGITPEQLAGEMADKATTAADLAHQAALDFYDLPEGEARRLLRLMSHHLADLAADAEAIA